MNKINPVIKKAIPDDAPKLAEFSENAFRNAFQVLNPEKEFNAYVVEAFSTKQITRELNDPDNTFFIAYDKEAWMGYVKLSRTDPPDCIDALPALEISRLYAAPEKIGYGIGTALVHAGIRFAKNKGYQSVWLGSWTKNHQGNLFYHKCGFRIVGSTTFALGRDIQKDHVFVRAVG